MKTHNSMFLGVLLGIFRTPTMSIICPPVTDWLLLPHRIIAESLWPLLISLFFHVLPTLTHEPHFFGLPS